LRQDRSALNVEYAIPQRLEIQIVKDGVDDESLQCGRIAADDEHAITYDTVPERHRCVRECDDVHARAFEPSEERIRDARDRLCAIRRGAINQQPDIDIAQWPGGPSGHGTEQERGKNAWLVGHAFQHYALDSCAIRKRRRV